MELRIFIISAFILICFSSCKKNRLRDDSVKTVKAWVGKEIKFPENLSCTSSIKDTTCVDLYSNAYKILLYVDALGCTSCRLNLNQWNRIIKDADSVFTQKPEFVFFFQPKKRDEKELLYLLKNNGFRHPVFIDKDNEIHKLNKFPSKSEYQCFLLDKDNKVVIVGNPSTNPGIWTLFKRIITEKKKEY